MLHRLRTRSPRHTQSRHTQSRNTQPRRAPSRNAAAFGFALLLALAPVAATAQTLASGLFDLGSSTGPGDPNFNSALTANHVLPAAIQASAGSELRVSLRDVSRPDMVCDLDDDFGDLFNGCAAVDWPFQDRRGINLVEVETVLGLRTLHLRIGDTLSPDPEPEGP